MRHSILDRETLLDITVNVVPILILAFFFVLFVTWTPWTGEPLITLISHFLTLFPLVLLAIVTYVAATYL